MGTPANPAVTADPAVPAGAPPAPTGSETPPAEPAPPPGAQQGSGEPPPGSPPETPNMRQLREQYEATKGELSKWKELGEHEEVSTSYQVYTQQREAILEMGKELGYTDEDILDSFHTDPLGTYSFLKNKQAEAAKYSGEPKDLEKLLDEKLDKRLKPITEREQKRQVDEASHRYDTEYDRLYKEAFPDGLPEDVAAFLYDMTTEMLSYDQPALGRIRNDGKVSDVAKYFNQAKERFLKVSNAWATHQSKRPGKPPQTPGDQPPKKLKVDDIINDPGVLGPKYAENA